MYILTSLWSPSFLSHYNLCIRYFEQPEIDLEKDFLLKPFSSSNLFNSELKNISSVFLARN